MSNSNSKKPVANYAYRQQQDYNGMNAMVGNPMMYHPVDFVNGAGQYGPSQHPAYYTNSPLPNIPPTPFDTAYGASLLPSHLLMGSPFVSSPNMQSGYNSARSSNLKRKAYSRPVSNHNGYNGNSNSNQNNTNNGMATPSNYYRVGRNSFSRNNNSTRNVTHNNNKGCDTRNNSGRRTFTRNNIFDDINPEMLLQRPFCINYKVLPTGDDAYRTRSLLIENVDHSIDLHSIVKNFVKSNTLESAYLIEGGKSDDSKDVETKNLSILISFLTKGDCLNFYNNILQRLSEFKTFLKSEALNLKFVCLNYDPKCLPTFIESEALTENAEEADITNGSTMISASLHHNIANKDATRSIIIEFKSPVEKSDLFKKKLQFLDRSKNKRYILESIDLVNTDVPSNQFPENYAVLTFLNISMAIEVLDYLKKYSKNLGISKCFYVSLAPLVVSSARSSVANIYEGKTSTHRLSVPSVTAGNNNDSNNNGNNNKSNMSGITTLNNNSSIGVSVYGHSNMSLTSLSSSASLNEEIDMLATKLQGVELDGTYLEINYRDYQTPTIEEHSTHLSNVKISKTTENSRQFSQDIPSPLPLNEHMFMNDSNQSNGAIIPQQLIATPSPVSPNLQMNQRVLPNPITQSLEQNFNVSAKVASSMGSDIGNRTIYIGNINPRSKAEDICNVVRGGILQSIKYIPEKKICFVTFIEAPSAVQFYANSFIDPIVLHGNMLRVGWGHYSGPLPKSISLAVTIGASRNVYVSLPEFAFKEKFIHDPQYKKLHETLSLPDAEQLREDFSTYGDIEQINYLSDSHCCWINFMNISSAISLVEEMNKESTVQNESGEVTLKRATEEKFGGRYKGLLINYGKDRCGNINKNLIAGKNSRFYKKVKRPSYNIRLSKLEEKRRQNEIDEKEKAFDKPLNLESLGISLDAHKDNGGGETGTANNTGHENESELEAENENGNETGSFGGLGLAVASSDVKRATSDETDYEDIFNKSSGSSDSSSDVEVIMHSPSDPEYALKSQTLRSSSQTVINSKRPVKIEDEEEAVGMSQLNYRSSLRQAPPRAPSTLSYNHSKNNETPMQDILTNGETANNRKKKRGSFPRHRTIPGSDVMAQYLAQVQHSTFMYAANILGASAEDNTHPDE
ncbi:nucleic acid binding protein [Saccharomyces pastorianus]|uniref:Nucleic acid binding protein n=1 Tax=Saccharomyces pastorianus TaxID=27292 RepID=A0A6C1DY09_SACPS|nr:nucleic acid binding protein [Saccharomyces pastorianus]